MACVSFRESVKVSPDAKMAAGPLEEASQSTNFEVFRTFNRECSLSSRPVEAKNIMIKTEFETLLRYVGG